MGRDRRQNGVMVLGGFLALLIAVTVVCDINLRNAAHMTHPVGGE
jgi:hypothetical protein